MSFPVASKNKKTNSPSHLRRHKLSRRPQRPSTTDRRLRIPITFNDEGGFSTFSSKHSIQHLLGERTWFASVPCQLELLACTHNRVFFKAFEQRSLQFVQTRYILFLEQAALCITYFLLWHNPMIVVGPHKELHTHVRSHQYFVHIRFLVSSLFAYVHQIKAVIVKRSTFNKFYLLISLQPIPAYISAPSPQEKSPLRHEFRRLWLPQWS